jgi:hypothetical protein
VSLDLNGTYSIDRWRSEIFGTSEEDGEDFDQ